MYIDWCIVYTPDKIILQATQQSLNLLNNLLYWAKIQSNRMIIKFKQIDFNLMVQDLEELLKGNIAEKEIKFQKIIEPDLTFTSDKLMVETILRNLLSNAIKYTQKNGSISLIAFRNKDLIKIQVKDNGIGIAPDKLQNIFQTYGNYSTSGTNNEKGTGLGLLLCKEFTNTLKGNIEVESKHGTGSVFSVAIPDVTVN